MRCLIKCLMALLLLTGEQCLAQTTGPNLQERTIADTTGIFLRRQEALLHQSSLELAATGWRRLIPSVRFGLMLSNRNLLAFGDQPAGAGSGVWQPSDAWTLSISWSLDAIVDPLPRRRAIANMRVARANMEWALLEHHQALRADSLKRARELQAQRARVEQLSVLLEMQEAKLRIQEELLALAAFKYEQGELPFEALAAARLSVLETKRQRIVAAHNLQAAMEQLPRLP